MYQDKPASTSDFKRVQIIINGLEKEKKLRA